MFNSDRADALRDAAKALEHRAEYNMDRTQGWSADRIAANNKLISQSRELWALWDKELVGEN